MVGELKVRLELHDDAQNHHRFYEIEVWSRRDLFDGPCVQIRYGRVGTSGFGLQLPFESIEGAISEASSRLQRRATAERRLGSPYRLVDIVVSAEFAFLAARVLGSFGRSIEEGKSSDQGTADDIQ